MPVESLYKSFINKKKTDILPIQTLAADLVTLSSPINVSNLISITFGIIHAKDHASASVGSGTVYQVCASFDDSGNRSWFALPYSFTAGLTAPVAMITDGALVAGDTVIPCGAALPAVGDIVCFKDALNTEFREVVARVATGGSETITIKDPLEFAHAQGTYYTQVEKSLITVPCDGLLRLRIMVNNNRGSTNRAVLFQVLRVDCEGIA